MEQISCSPDTEQHAAVHQSVAPTGYGTAAEMRESAGSGAPGADSRHDLSTLMLQGSFYHPSTLTLVSRAKVRSEFYSRVKFHSHYTTSFPQLVFHIRRVALILALLTVYCHG